MKLYKRLAVILAACVLTIGISSTWAYYSDTQSVVNPFYTTNSAIDMIEDFNPADTMLPGETVEKKPYFVNTGDTDLVLRLKMTTYWLGANGNQRNDLRTDMVTLKYPENFGNNWVEIDGYYYYFQVLESKEHTQKSKTSLFVESLTLKPDVSNDNHAADYSDCQFVVDFDAEAVPADADSVANSGWGLNQSTVGTDKLEWQDLLPNGN